MSKLPKAPLVEVIFKLKWHVKKEEIEKYRYFSGDYYSVVKENYSQREALIPDGIPIPLYINRPSHQFYDDSKKYPKIQIGPGILTVNTVDDFYFWEDYKKHISEAAESLFKIIHNFSDLEHVHLYLDYIDFLPFNFNSEDISKYLKKYLHVSLDQSFYDGGTLNDLNLVFEFKNPIGKLNVEISKGKVEDSDNGEDLEGIIISTSAKSEIFSSEIKKILEWTDEAHELCSSVFKDMTAGELYESFQ